LAVSRALDGKVAFVAGGSSGINLGVALGFAEAGAKVALISRSSEKIEAAAKGLRDAGHDAIGMAADVRDFAAVDQALAAAREKWGDIDIVLSGAAGNFVAPASEMSANGFKTVIDIDLLGTFNVFRASYPYIRKPGASLIAITAAQAEQPIKNQIHVCAAKAGVNMVTKCLDGASLLGAMTRQMFNGGTWNDAPGTQGTLFGQNSTGGAINFIAAKPTDTWTAGGTFAFSRFNTADFQGYVSGPLSSTLEARLAVRSVQGGDWQQSYTRDAGHGQQDFTQARFILDWRPVDRLKISFNANGFHDGSDTQAAQFKAFLPGVPSRISLVPLLANYPVAPSDARAADFNAGQNYASNNNFVQAILHADYEVSSALTLTSITTYSNEKVKQLIDSDGTSLTNINIFIDGHVSTISEEARAAGRLGRVNYILGATYERDRTREGGYQDISYSTLAFSIAPPPFPPLDVFGTNVNQNFDTKAVFGNFDHQVLDKVTLHGGVRYTQADLSYNACTLAGSANLSTAFGTLTNILRRSAGLPAISNPAVGQCASLDATLTPALGTGVLNQGSVSWRAGIDVKPRPGVLLYANASKGFKAGSVTSAPNQINAQFKPVVAESVQAYEAGFKATLLNRKLELNGAGFYYDYRNKQLQGKVVFTPNIFGPINALINVPKSRILGAEAQASLYPVSGLALNVGVTYLDTKVVGDFLNYSFVGNPANFNGNPFPFTPKYQAVLGADYRHHVSAGRSAFIGVDANIRSHTTAGFGNDPQAYIPSYSVVDALIGIERDDGRWRAELFGRNITNAYYYTDVVRVIDTVRTYAGMPATYGIRFSFRY